MLLKSLYSLILFWKKRVFVTDVEMSVNIKFTEIEVSQGSLKLPRRPFGNFDEQLISILLKQLCFIQNSLLIVMSYCSITYRLDISCGRDSLA